MLEPVNELYNLKEINETQLKQLLTSLREINSQQINHQTKIEELSKSKDKNIKDIATIIQNMHKLFNGKDINESDIKQLLLNSSRH